MEKIEATEMNVLRGSARRTILHRCQLETIKEQMIVKETIERI